LLNRSSKLPKQQKKEQVFQEEKLYSGGFKKRNSVMVESTWVEKGALKQAIDYQTKIVTQGAFSPFDYFGWSYMKDYLFYKNNPRLEIAFKSPQRKKSCKKKKSNDSRNEILVNSKYDLEAYHNYKLDKSNESKYKYDTVGSDSLEISSIASKVRLIFWQLE